MTTERSYWFCCKTKCPAKGILHSDGKFQVTNFEHTHHPNVEDIKKKEKLVELRKLALQMDVSGRDLLEVLDIKENVKKHLSFIRTCRSRNKKQKQFEGNIPMNVGLNYKRLASRKPSKEMISYSGYLFRQDSINRQNECCKYWRCREKNCRARAKTDEEGNLTILKSTHNHAANKSDENAKKCRQMLKTEAETLNKPVCEVIEQPNIKSDNLKKYIWKVRKSTEKETHGKLDTLEKSVPVTEDSNLVLNSSVTDSETFSLEKLMAETLGENYCMAPEFS